MYGASKSKPNLEKLRAMGLYVHEANHARNKVNQDTVKFSVDFDKRRVRLLFGARIFETFLGEERYCYAFDTTKKRMYFVPAENGYKMSKVSKSSYTTYISGDSFDEIRCLSGCITNLKKFPERKLIFDSSVGLYYVNLITDKPE